jgi:hypothetical protein
MPVRCSIPSAHDQPDRPPLHVPAQELRKLNATSGVSVEKDALGRATSTLIETIAFREASVPARFRFGDASIARTEGAG